MNAKIIFGSKRLGRHNASTTSEKYAGLPVLTIEPVKERGKSRRILFNKTASSLLGLKKGSVDKLVFGTLIVPEDGNKRVILANNNLVAEVNDLKFYKTSKQDVYFYSTKEKGKAISVSAIANEITAFLELDGSIENELKLNVFDVDGIEYFYLSLIKENVKDNNIDINESFS